LEKKGLSGKKWENVVNLYQKIGKRVFTQQNRAKNMEKTLSSVKTQPHFSAKILGMAVQCSTWNILPMGTNTFNPFSY